MTVRRSTSANEFRNVVNGQDTMTVRRERILTKGYSVVRHVRSRLRERLEQA